MSEIMNVFQNRGRQSIVMLPFDLDEVILSWDFIRTKMTQSMPEAFTREEWAYLVQFLSKELLLQPFYEYFGDKQHDCELENSVRLFKRKGNVGIWLPNNVSLLGPLIVILISLTGCPIYIKAGSRSKNLMEPFLNYLIEHAAPGALRSYLEKSVRIELFGHDDQRNLDMSKKVDVRFFFGSDGAADAVEKMDHSVNSMGFYFTDRVSQAWIEPACIDDKLIETLIKVFAVYGQAGCTSPRRVVLIDGHHDQAKDVAFRIAERWSSVIKKVPGPHVASTNIMAKQWARSLGWQSKCVPNNHAVVAWGAADLNLPEAPMLLCIEPAGLSAAFENLPANIQTIGCQMSNQLHSRIIQTLALTNKKNVLRIVPLTQMHHFHYIWDGHAFWRELFSEIDIRR